jgi:hypothetical protein
LPRHQFKTKIHEIAECSCHPIGSGMPYLESSRNVFLKQNNLLLFIDNQKLFTLKKTIGNRTFTKTGLKVLFYLLQNKEAIHLTHRKLADQAQVGLGNILQVIDGLRKTGFLVPLNKKTMYGKTEWYYWKDG